MRRRLAALSLVILSLVVGFGIVELALRAMDFSYYWSVSKAPDEHAGWRPRPGAVAWQRIEGEALVRINSAGYRDREHVRDKPAGAYRIAVLGDSFTAAVQVPLEATWWRLAEDYLASCPAFAARAPELLSFAVSGYSTAQALLTLRHRVWDYEPDLVLLAFFQGNDLVENHPALDDDPMRPYFGLDAGRLVLDDTFRDLDAYRFRQSTTGRIAFGALASSRALQLADQARDMMRVRSRAVPVEDGALTEPGVDLRVYAPPADPAWEASWAVTEAMLTGMSR
jgi:hypothetical protein